MTTNHDVWDNVAATDGTPAQSFEFLLGIDFGGSVKRTADIADLNPAFTAKTRARNTYAAKGVDQALKYGDNLVMTWNHEAIRDLNGEFQPELLALLRAARANGAANLMHLQAYDALGADYAFDGIFAISTTRQGTGWDDKGWFAITATQYKFNGWIANPVKSGNIPNVTAANPSGAASGATVFLQGSGFLGTTGVKFGAKNATSFNVVNDTLISAVLPTDTAGSAVIAVTNAAGVSSSFPYTRGA